MIESSGYCEHCQKQVLIRKDNISGWSYFVLIILFTLVGSIIPVLGTIIGFWAAIFLCIAVRILDSFGGWKCSQCGQSVSNNSKVCENNNDTDTNTFILLIFFTPLIFFISEFLIMFAIAELEWNNNSTGYAAILPFGICYLFVRKIKLNKKKKTDKEIETIIQTIMSEHYSTLMKKYKKLIYKGDYGEIIYDKWNEELNHFIECIVRPQLTIKISDVELRELVTKIFSEYDNKKDKQKGE